MHPYSLTPPHNNHWPSAIGHSSSGMILVTVLLFMAIIMALVIHSQVVARMALRFEERQSMRAQLRVAAADAAWTALHRLADDDNLQVDHTNETWAALQTNCLPNTIKTFALITDENRYFNVNNLAIIPVPSSREVGTAVRLPAAIIQDMFAAGNWPDPAGTTQALKDWVDRDAEGTREAGHDHQAHRSQAPPNAPMESPAELADVLNAMWAEFRAPPPALTVLPDCPTATPRTAIRPGLERITPVNVNTAGREVLQAVLGAGQSILAERICRQRDAHPLTDLNRMMDAKTLDTFRPYLDTRSRYFSLVAQADRNGHQETVYALVQRNDQGEIEILRWVHR